MSADEPDFYSQVSRPDIGSQVLSEQLHDAKKQLAEAQIKLTVDKAAIRIKDGNYKEL